MEFISNSLVKVATDIQGLDEIIGGGLPQGRTTLVCGGPGCGKTLLATEFLVRGALEYGEPGVFMAFEETEEELTKNVAWLGIDLSSLIEQKKIFVDYVASSAARLKRRVNLWVQPITSLGLNYQVSDQHISTGVAALESIT